MQQPVSPLIKFNICRRHHITINNSFEYEIAPFTPKYYLDFKGEIVYDFA